MYYPPLKGIWPVVPTPFDDDGNVDHDAFLDIVRYVDDWQLDGFVYPGFASEVETLTAEERCDLLKTIAGFNHSHVKLVAGATADSVDEVLATAEQATALKVSTIMIQPPNRLGRHEERIIDFLTTVAEAFPELRIVLQNAPAPRGLNLDAMQLRRIVRSVEQIAYIKEETIPSGPTILALLNDPDRPDNLKGVIGGGGGRYIIDELRRGACAAMPAIELSDVQAALHAAWQAGDHSLADEIYTRTLPLLTMQAAYRMRLTKHVLIQRGILENAHVRASCPFMDGIAKAEANARLRDLLTYRKMQEMQQELEIEF